MTHGQLKYLVKLYRETSKALGDLKDEYENSNMHRELLDKILATLKQERDSSPRDYDKRKVSDTIFKTLLGPETDAIDEINRNAEIKATSLEVQLKIAYAEMKLSVMKQILGQEVVKEIETSEIESIRKMVLNSNN